MWDPVVRLTHWAVAAIVVFSFVRDDGGEIHRNVGYVGVGLVVLRLLWALRPGRHASLAALRPSPRATLAYLRASAPRTLGHDPLGVWMVWILWTLVLALGLTGWMSRLDAFWGDDFLQDLHAWLADALMVCVGLHVVAVVVMSRRWRENLPAAMWTGKKRADDAVRRPS